MGIENAGAKSRIVAGIEITPDQQKTLNDVGIAFIRALPDDVLRDIDLLLNSPIPIPQLAPLFLMDPLVRRMSIFREAAQRGILLPGFV